MDVYPLKALAIDRLSTSGLDYITVLLRLYLFKSHGIPFAILVIQVLSCLFYRGPECFVYLEITLYLIAVSFVDMCKVNSRCVLQPQHANDDVGGPTQDAGGAGRTDAAGRDAERRGVAVATASRYGTTSFK